MRNFGGSGAFCARTAQALSQRIEGSVCVVDANFRVPSLHRYFRLENKEGLLQAVFQGDTVASYAQPLSVGNLWLLPVGSLPKSPHDGISWHRLRTVVSELRAQFDYVLIDAPPVGSYLDATLLGHLADGVVMVVEANTTRREAARRAKRTLEAARLRVLAAVLNKRTFPIPNSIYDVFCRRFRVA